MGMADSDGEAAMLVIFKTISSSEVEKLTAMAR